MKVVDKCQKAVEEKERMLEKLKSKVGSLRISIKDEVFFKLFVTTRKMVVHIANEYHHLDIPLEEWDKFKKEVDKLIALEEEIIK